MVAGDDAKQGVIKAHEGGNSDKAPRHAVKAFGDVTMANITSLERYREIFVLSF